MLFRFRIIGASFSGSSHGLFIAIYYPREESRRKPAEESELQRLGEETPKQTVQEDDEDVARSSHRRSRADSLSGNLYE